MGHPRSHRQAALPEMGPSHSGVTGRKFGTCGGKWFSLAELRIKFFFFFRGQGYFLGFRVYKSDFAHLRALEALREKLNGQFVFN